MKDLFILANRTGADSDTTGWNSFVRSRHNGNRNQKGLKGECCNFPHIFANRCNVMLRKNERSANRRDVRLSIHVAMTSCFALLSTYFHTRQTQQLNWHSFEYNCPWNSHGSLTSSRFLLHRGASSSFGLLMTKPSTLRGARSASVEFPCVHPLHRHRACPTCP